MKKSLLWVIVLVLGGKMASAQQIPISRVLLYKNGMAYLVRSGSIQEPLSLSFHSEDMNDVLKSITAWNPETATLYPVGYTTGISLTETLGRFPFQLSAKDGLPGFLKQITGARIQVDRGSTTLSGMLVSVSSEQHAVDRQTLVNDYRLSVFDTTRGIQSLWLSEVNSLQLEDPQLNRELQTYLRVLVQGKQDVLRDVTIYPIPDTGAINVAYIQQFPVWKTSYRVEIAQSETWLQSWAQVDNPTGEAWNDVDLTLVSGMPASFIMDLYEPVYTSRGEVPVPGLEVLTPRMYEAAVRTESEVAAEAPAAQDGWKMAAERMALGKRVRDLLPRRSLENFQQAQTAQIQDYFEYHFPFPVRLAARESALLPFMKRKISLERTSIFNARDHRNHPLTGAWLHNDTGVALDAGPVTFFADGRYIGEAVLDHLSKDERRLVSYGVDYDVEVAVGEKSRPEITVGVSVNRGTIRLEKEKIQGTVYRLKSKAGTTRTLLIEHPRMPDRELKNPTPVETTENFYRFRLDLEPGQELDLPVSEILSREVAISVGELDRRQLEVHFAGVEIPARLEEELSEVVSTRERIAALQAELERVQEQIETIFRDQARLRENLRSLGRTEQENQLRERYLNQWNDQENQVAQLRDRVEVLGTEIARQEDELSEQISSISFSADLVRKP